MELVRLGAIVTRDGDDRREPPGPAHHWHVVRGGDDDRAVEVGLVEQLVKRRGELPPGRREAQVHDAAAPFERPAKARDEISPASGEVRADHPHADQLALRRDRSDQRRARRAVTADVGLVVGLGDRLVVISCSNDDRFAHARDVGVVGIDARIDEPHEDAVA